MDNDAVRKHLMLAAELSAASKRYSGINDELTKEFADQAIEILKHVEASFQPDDPVQEATVEEDRPVSIQLMPPIEGPKFERLAAAVAEDRERVQFEAVRRRRPIVDRSCPDIETPDVPARRRFCLSTSFFAGLLVQARLRARAFFSPASDSEHMPRQSR